MPSNAFKYYAVYKPYGYLSQFTQEAPGQLTLKDLHEFPPDVYPIGRLDKNSEGLLILTNDTRLNKKLLDPTQKKPKTYLVQIEGCPTDEAIEPLESPMKLRIKKKAILLKPAQVKIIPEPQVPPRNPPIRVRKSIPDSWLEISITEGKFHQVRKMCAAIGYPVLRLIRSQIGNYKIPSFDIGRVWELSSETSHALV